MGPGVRDTPMTATAPGRSMGASEAAVAARSRSSDDRTPSGDIVSESCRSTTPASVREVMETLARAAGLPPPTRSVPYPIALGIGHALWNAFRLAGASKAPPVTPFVVKLMSRHVVYDAGKAARVLGWKPRLGSLEGVARYAKAFRKVG